MTNAVYVVREVVNKLRETVKSLIKLHRTGQFHNFVTSEVVNGQLTLSLTTNNDQICRPCISRSDNDIQALGRAFVNAWELLMIKSLVPELPIELKELCQWMTNHSEYNNYTRPHLAHVLAGLDFIIDRPEEAPSHNTVQPDQLPSNTYSFEELKPHLVNVCYLSSGSFCKTYLFSYKGQQAVCKLGEDDDQDTLRDFWREALLLDYLQGAGGSPVLLAICSDRPCIFMSCVEGKTLNDVYGGLTARGMVEVFLELAHSLQQVHEAGVLHHDVKSDNVLVKVPMAGEGQVQASYIDFGFGTLGERVASMGDFDFIDYIRYPRYAPEDFFNRWASPASDIFALGMMFEELMVHKMKAGQITTWPEGLQELVADMVEYEEEDRPSLTEVRAKLTTILPSLAYLPRSLEGSDDSDDDESESDEDQDDRPSLIEVLAKLTTTLSSLLCLPWSCVGSSDYDDEQESGEEQESGD